MPAPTPRSMLLEALPDIDEVPEEFVDESLFAAFLAWCDANEITLYPAQEEAIMSLVAQDNVILSTPTGSGKSLVALAAHFFALARHQKTFYTAPIKALVSEKFFSLCEIFGPENVGMMTGDASVNVHAPIMCATAEIVANLSIRQGEESSITQVIMDEFHYYSDPERGWAWQIPLLGLPHAQFLLMSATLGNTDFLAEDLSKKTVRTTTLVTGSTRPVPLEFEYTYTPIHETIQTLVDQHKTPAYIVHFSQRAAAEQAQALLSENYATDEQKSEIVKEIGDFSFSTKFGKTLSRLLRKGIGIHHAGMLPKYRRLVERLAQRGLLTIICGTDTLGVGINVPIRTVVFTGLAKFDGTTDRILKSREFHQIAGRAGRAGYDTVGTVVVQAPEHEIENYQLRSRAGQDEKKLKKLRKKSAPAGQIVWTENTFERLKESEAEPLTSQFRVSNALLLNLAAREESSFEAFSTLIRGNHDSRAKQNSDIRQAIELYRGLKATGVITENSDSAAGHKDVHLNENLSPDFALNQPLAPFALAALDLLDSEYENYPLDIISVFESIVEDPRPVLQAQQRQARAEEIDHLKQEGVDFHDRKAIVDDITWPKPLNDELNSALDIYRQGHPWARDYSLSPKSVLRVMIEQAMTFSDLISTYGLERSEGVVLHYLMEIWRALDQTLPDSYRTQELDDILVWLREMIKQVDNSLVEEWALLNNPDLALTTENIEQFSYGVEENSGISANPSAFKTMIGNLFFRHIELFALEKEDELEALDSYLADPPDWPQAMDDYFDEYSDIGIGLSARGKGMFRLDSPDADNTVYAEHIIEDPHGDNSWRLAGRVDISASDAAGEVILKDLSILTH